jgi:hypothetical protein
VDKPRSLKHPERCGDATDEGTVEDDDDVEIGDECKAETEVESDKTLERAMQNGLPAEKEVGLRRIGSTHANVFWTRLAADPAVDDKPVQILPDEEVPPYRAKVRRCRPPQLAFLADRVRELESWELSSRHEQSKGVCAAQRAQVKSKGLQADSRPAPSPSTHGADRLAHEGSRVVLAPACSLNLLR